MSSAWVSMNVLMLDEKRVFVERQELSLRALLKRAGFECIPIDFRHVWSFGGSFHCVTLDVRRRGTLQRYF
jgi:glycine amidinotransferase